MQIKNIVVSKGRDTFCVFLQVKIPGQRLVNLTYDCNSGNLVLHEWSRLTREMIDEIYAECLDFFKIINNAERRKKKLERRKKKLEERKKEKRIGFSKEMREKIYEAYDGKCAICGRPLQIERNGDDYCTIDHIIPLDKGGKNEISNYQAACHCCNQIKSNIMPEIFKNKFEAVLVDRIMEDSSMRKTIIKKIVKVMFRESMMAIKAMIL